MKIVAGEGKQERNFGRSGGGLSSGGFRVLGTKNRKQIKKK